MSVVIPTHEMADRVEFFKRCMDSLWNQSFQNFEIVVSDNSDDDVIEDLCYNWYKTGVRYLRNPNKGMAQNTNWGMQNASGEIIKILYMDDYMAHDEALETIYDAFMTDTEWLATGCSHVIDFDPEPYNKHYPKFSTNIHLENTVGSPSVIALKNHFSKQILFDENMTWLLDADLYKRLYEAYGEPKLINDINVVIGLGEHQATHILSSELKAKEYNYSQQKHG